MSTCAIPPEVRLGSHGYSKIRREPPVRHTRHLQKAFICVCSSISALVTDAVSLDIHSLTSNTRAVAASITCHTAAVAAHPCTFVILRG